MSELTHAEYRDSSIFDSSRWQTIRGDDMIFLDPATGNQLREDRPPEWLLADQRIARGYETLRDMYAGGHELTMAYGGHAFARDLDRPQDEGPPIRDWYERMHGYVSAVALERVGATRRHVQRQIDARVGVAAMAPARGFGERQYRALAWHQRPFLLPDIPGMSHVPLDMLLLEGMKIATGNAGPNDRTIPIAEANRLFFPLQHMREWYNVGKYCLEAAEMQDVIGPAPRVLFPIGSEHQDMTRKFNVFGMPVSEVNLVQVARRRQITMERSRMVGAGRMPIATVMANGQEWATRRAGFRPGAAPHQRSTRLE